MMGLGSVLAHLFNRKHSPSGKRGKHRMMKFRIKTGVPKGRNTWEPDTASKVQASLFATVAMIVAENPDAEKLLHAKIAEAKLGIVALPA